MHVCVLLALDYHCNGLSVWGSSDMKRSSKYMITGYKKSRFVINVVFKDPITAVIAFSDLVNFISHVGTVKKVR